MLDNYLYNHKGLYKVGNKAFTNKLEACLALNNIPGDHQIHWDYHDDVYKRAQWLHEPPVSIDELYKQRAIQLREQYDHLVLFYSGGADSHTILQTFINNNIKIDEVFVYGAFKAEEKLFPVWAGVETLVITHVKLSASLNLCSRNYKNVKTLKLQSGIGQTRHLMH